MTVPIDIGVAPVLGVFVTTGILEFSMVILYVEKRRKVTKLNYNILLSLWPQ